MAPFSELTSRAVGFLKKLSPERIKRLTREEFAEALGIDPKEVPLKDRMEIARALYSEFKQVVSYRWLSDKLNMSLRDVQRAVKGEKAEGEGLKPSMKFDPELVARAIELFRDGKVRNPNDLVLELRVNLEVAEQLYERIAENEKAVAMPVVEAVRKIERALKEASKHEERLKEVGKALEDYKGLLDELRKGLEALKVEYEGLRKKSKSLWKELRELFGGIGSAQLRLIELGSDVKTLMDLLTKVRGFEEELGGLKRSVEALLKKVENIEASLKARGTAYLGRPRQP
jgi:chromosome segregation ATPase